MANNYDDFDVEPQDGDRRRLSFVTLLTILIAIAAIAVVLLLVYVLVTPDNFITDLFGTGQEEALPP